MCFYQFFGEEKNLIDARMLVIALLQMSECARVSTCLKVLNSLDLAASPCMLSATTVLASDLELPGLPTTNSGILSSMQTTIMNTFSLRAVFRAMLGPSSNSLSTARWQLRKIINIFTAIYLLLYRAARFVNFEAILSFSPPSII